MDLDAAVGANTDALYERMRVMELKDRPTYNEGAKYLPVRFLHDARP